jgi:hypothetical protein
VSTPEVSMWEVRAVDGQLAALQAWVLARVDPAAQVFRSAAGEPRLVVIDPTSTAVTLLAELPGELAARPAHSWQFVPVRNV